MTPRHGLSTRSIHAGEAPDPSTGAHGVPIYQNATYAFRSYQGVEAWREGAPHFLYARDGNPTVRSLELKLADLEGAEDAVATATGMAAVSATLLHLVAGGHLVASADVYAVTKEFLNRDLPAFGATVSLVDFGDPAAVEAAITPRTRVLFCEPFSNPMLKVADLPALGALAARRGIPLVVDNTFLSPALLRPLEQGATIVVHSATKYLSGHGNVLGGVVCGPKAAIVAIRGLLSRLGGTMGAFAAWLLLNGTKTLPLRVERHSTNAARLAALLAAHPAVAAVHYPGLPSHPEHAAARRLVGDRFGGMLAFELAGGEPAIGPFLDALTLPTIAVSLGDVGTLIWPIFGGGVLRLSVGLEDLADLEADFAAALTGASEAPALEAPATTEPERVRAVGAHYARGDLGSVILGAVRAAGLDPDQIAPDDLAPVDQFHIGGKAATLALARMAGVRSGQAVLDVGGGLGGPARTLAREFGCAVTVLDLTADYCAAGATLTARTGLAERVGFVNGNALDLPFGDARFDLGWTQHSSMNIEDKDRLYAEIRRVLRPGGRLALHEIASGRRFPVHFPVPWAANQTLSHLRPPAELRALLTAAGFAELTWEDVTDATLAAIMAPSPGAAGTAPSPLGLHLLLGDACSAMQQNLVRNLSEGRIAVVRGVFERR